MNRIFLFFICVCGSNAMSGQNLIPNPGFEDFIQCPDDHGQIDRSEHWSQTNRASSDYFHRCSGSGIGTTCNPCVPNNGFGVQEPRTGDAYAGIFCMWPNATNFREYLQVDLIAPLMADTMYELSFYLCLSEFSFNALSDFGGLFTSTRILNQRQGQFINRSPQVSFNQPVTDKENWTLVSGCFVADGTERVLIIGNFIIDALNTVTPLPSGLEENVHYLIDDVSLVKVASENFELGADSTLCNGDSIIIDISNYPGTITWNDGGTERIKTIKDAGKYWVTVTTGCQTYIDTIEVTFEEGENLNLGRDTSLCKGDTLLLKGSTNQIKHIWQDGSTDTTFLVENEGHFWLELETSCGIIRDSIFVQYLEEVDIDLGVDTTLCEGETLLLLGSTRDINHNWQDGSTDTSFLVEDEGYYWLELKTICGIVRDSIFVNYFDAVDVDLGVDTTLCDGETLLLLGSTRDINHNWQDGSTDTTFLVENEGYYWLELNTSCGTVRDSIFVNYFDEVDVDLGVDTTLCEGETLLLQGSTRDINHIWQNGSSDTFFIVFDEGTYWLELNTICGISRDSIFVSYTKELNINLGADTTLCDGEILRLITENDLDVVWHDGSINQDFVVDSPGDYWVIGKNICGEDSDSINVSYMGLPTANLGSDTTLCEGSSLLITVQGSGFNHQWQDGSIDSFYQVQNTGLYWLETSNECGLFRDSLNVNFIDQPTVDLGEDLVLCDQDSIVLHNNGNDQNVLWSNGSNADSIIVKQSGIIAVEVFNDCGSAQDEIDIVFEKCQCNHYVPNIFTPNGDGLNDKSGPIFSDCPIEDFRFMVFSRWGELVFDTEVMDEQWDGAYNGQHLPSDVFVYTITFKDRGGTQSSSGSITLIR